MKKIISLVLLGVSLKAAAFEGNNKPSYFDKNYNYNFNSLPLSGSLGQDKMPWSSSFWPHQYGGIAFRWFDTYTQTPDFVHLHDRDVEIRENILELQGELVGRDHTTYEIQELDQKISSLKFEGQRVNSQKANYLKRYFFDINRPNSKSDVLRLSQAELDRLSPAEKYDIYVGNYNFKLTKNVLDLTKPTSQYWEGICNGWSSAALEFSEPKSLTVTNKDGITINFGSSDLKALLAHYHAAITNNVFTMKKNLTNRVGERCQIAIPKEAWYMKNDKEYYRTIENGRLVEKEVPADCVDLNAGAFHVVIANQLALKNEGFVAEVVRDVEVWNQPVYAYETEILETLNVPKRNATKGTVKQVRVKTKMSFANDGGRVFWGTQDPEDEFYAWWDATNGTSNYRHASKDFEYLVDLDRRGNIIGGQWLSYERPDFLWIKKSKGFLGDRMFFGIVGYMDDLKNLVETR